jgi:hypothetical protein
MKRQRIKVKGIIFLLAAMSLALTGCGGGGDGDDNTSSYYDVGVVVSGLPAGDSVVLQNNGNDDLSVSMDGAATFSKSQIDGSSYHVTVEAQPADTTRLCAVIDPAGTINGAAAEVTVDCTDIVTLSGTVEYSQDGSMRGGVPIEVRNAVDDSVLAQAASQTAVNGILGHYSVSAPSGIDFYLHAAATNIEGTDYLGSNLQIENESADRGNIKFYLIDTVTAAAVGTTIGVDPANDAIIDFDVEDAGSNGIAGVTTTADPAVTAILYNQDDTGSNFSPTPPTTIYNGPSAIGYLAAPAAPVTVTFTLDPDQTTMGYTIDTTFELRLIAGEISSPIEP